MTAEWPLSQVKTLPATGAYDRTRRGQAQAGAAPHLISKETRVPCDSVGDDGGSGVAPADEALAIYSDHQSHRRK